jgi:TPR repeat protein
MIKQGAKKGVATAQNNLATCFANGIAVPQKHSKAVKWYSRAAEQGNTEAMANLGIAYDKGRGVDRDHAKAARWFGRAAESGHQNSRYILAVMLLEGRGESCSGQLWRHRSVDALGACVRSLRMCCITANCAWG